MILEEALSQPGTLLAAWMDTDDPKASDIEFCVFSVGAEGRAEVWYSPFPREERIAVCEAVFARGIRMGACHASASYAWVADDVGYSLWSKTEVVCEGNRAILKLAGGAVPVSQIVEVLSFADLERQGDRGVRCKLKDGSYVAVVERFEPPNEEPLVDFGNDLIFSRDSWWTRALARDLANWLGVAHDDRVISSTSNEIDLALNAFGRSMADRAEALPPTGGFDPVELKYGTLGETPVELVLLPDWLGEGRRTCELKVWTPTRTSSASQDVARGSRKHLASQLRSVRFAKDVLAALRDVKRTLWLRTRWNR